MPSLKSIARRLSDRAFGTEFDRALERSRDDPRKGFLFYWNRGLGDIALGLVPLFERIRNEVPEARIAVLTREELRVPFELTNADEVHVLAGLQREARVDMRAACATLGLAMDAFGTVFEYPDPNRWLIGRRQAFPPKLSWIPRWDALAENLMPSRPGEIVIGAHVHSETRHLYGYVKDWPPEFWQQLLGRFACDSRAHWVLFGYEPQPPFVGDNITDLRGKTDLPGLLSVIKNRCRVLIAPDSGVLTMAYYLDAPFDLDVISLWSDPRQGILLQGCPSPNAKLRHVPLIGEDEDVRNIPVGLVEDALEGVLRTLSPALSQGRGRPIS